MFLDDYQLPGHRKGCLVLRPNLGWSLEEISPDDDEHQWAVVRTATEPDTPALRLLRGLLTGSTLIRVDF